MNALRPAEPPVGGAALAWSVVGVVALAAAVQAWSLARLAITHGALALLLAACLWRGRAGFTVPRALAALLVLWLAWAAASAWLSPARPLAAIGWWVLAPAPAMALAWWAGGLGRHWPRVVGGLVAIGVTLAVLALAERWLTGALPRVTFRQPNSLAGFLAPLALLAGGRWLYGSARGARGWGLVAFAVIGLAVASSLSRGALLAWGAGLVVLLAGARGPAPRARAVLVAVALAAVLAVNLAGSGALSARIGGALSAIEALGEPPAPAQTLEPAARSAAERWLIWGAAWRALQAAPWHGYGPGTFQAVYPRWRDPGDTSAGQYAHDDWLQLAAELGIPGMALLAALAAVLAMLAGRALAPGRDPETPAVVVSGAALLAMVVHASVSYVAYLPANALLAGLLLARFAELAAGSAGRLALEPRRALRPAVIVGLCGALAMAWASMPLRALGAERALAAARQAMARGALPEADRLLDRAARWYPTAAIAGTRAVLYLGALRQVPIGDAGRRATLHGAALAALALAQARDPWAAEPYHLRAMLALAAPEAERGDARRTAHDALARALALDPWHHRSRVALARLLVAAGHWQAARRLLEDGVALSYPAAAGLADYARVLAGLRRRDGDGRGARRLQQVAQRLEATSG